MNKRNIKWDANWGRLTLETKLNKLRDRLNFCYEDSLNKATQVSVNASTALYVANKNR
jgi:hypothetical protein